jgi:ribosome-binding protein aMBF1 (putative translation factor)
MRCKICLKELNEKTKIYINARRVCRECWRNRKYRKPEESKYWKRWEELQEQYETPIKK